MKLVMTILMLVCTCVAFSKDKKQGKKKGKGKPGSVVYKTIDDKELVVRVFNPSGHKPTDKNPAVIFFYGGGRN